MYDQQLSPLPLSLSSKPWAAPDAEIAEEIFIPHGMLGPEERAALFWLAREHCDGRGHIVDAGAFLGTSAMAMASGLAHSRHPKAKQVKVFSYDLFHADEQYVADTIRQRYPHFANGQSFRGIYDLQVGSHHDRIVAMEGDFTRFRWLGAPIEMLFVDLDKSHELHRAFLLEYYPHLIPAHSLVLHQDWYLSRHPWLHFGMEYLEPYFSLVDPLVKWCTRVFKLENPIPPEALATLADRALGYEREIYLLDKLIEREQGGMKEMIILSKVTHRLSNGDRDLARREFEAAEFSHMDDPALDSEWRHVQGLVT